ncbi:MAG TPA: hypothetical protein VNG51_04925 [Ktedonobacteraceae bacterium]|nr:hypothetical protein [Ktedonobacteraceae bacterium]
MTSKNTPVEELTAEIVDFYDAIVEKVAALRLETQQTMAKIKKEQQEQASQLQQNLAQGESLRKADFQKLMNEVIARRKVRETEVMAMLAQFQQEEQIIAVGLKKLFSDGRQVRLRDFKRFIADTERTTVARKAEIAEINQMSMAIRKSAEETIARFREEREEMAQSWKTLAVKMQKRRSHGTMLEPKASAMPAIVSGKEKIQKKGSRNTKSEPKAPEMLAALPLSPVEE